MKTPKGWIVDLYSDESVVLYYTYDLREAKMLMHDVPALTEEARRLVQDALVCDEEDGAIVQRKSTEWKKTAEIGRAHV